MRNKANQWAIKKDRLGIMGFSAGGELVNLLTFSKNKSTNTAHDLVQKENPNFHILIYPEPLTVPKKVSKSAPPLFSLASNNDQCCSASIFKLLKAYREVGADVEAHFYSKGDHGGLSSIVVTKNLSP